MNALPQAGMGKVTSVVLHDSATFQSTRCLPAVTLVFLTVSSVKLHSFYRGENWNSRALGTCAKPHGLGVAVLGHIASGNSPSVCRETRPGGSATECFVPGPFLTLPFSFFFLNAHPLLPLLVMISRTLGPEVGGSIGLMFYLANVCGCAVSLLGLVEAVLDVFGAGLCSPARYGRVGRVWDSGIMRERGPLQDRGKVAH